MKQKYVCHFLLHKFHVLTVSLRMLCVKISCNVCIERMYVQHSSSTWSHKWVKPFQSDMAVFVQTRQLHIPLLVSMLHCSLIRGLTYMYILNLQMKKVSSWDTGKVKVSKDVKTNKIPDSDEKKNRDLTISWIKNAYEFCFSRSFIPCIFTMVAYARDLKLW